MKSISKIYHRLPSYLRKDLDKDFVLDTLHKMRLIEDKYPKTQSLYCTRSVVDAYLSEYEELEAHFLKSCRVRGLRGRIPIMYYNDILRVFSDNF